MFTVNNKSGKTVFLFMIVQFQIAQFSAIQIKICKVGIIFVSGMFNLVHYRIKIVRFLMFYCLSQKATKNVAGFQFKVNIFRIYVDH